MQDNISADVVLLNNYNQQSMKNILITGASGFIGSFLVEEALKSEFETIYIDAKAVNDADLSGVNEVIHSHYTLEKAGKKLVFVYLKNSIVENWVETSGLDKFVTTAIIIS
jgi:nucleoside-diphosphate-sugar epimerase